ncbi:MAG: WYL domain-containing protein [Chthoniobacterales bacterium]
MPAKSPKKSPPPRRVPEGITRPPMERMWRIHQEVSGGEYPNCQGLGVQLEVSAKTVMRDVEFMRDRLGLPLEYDAIKHGFHYTAPVRDFPIMKVSQGEVAALLLAQKSLEQFRGTTFERPLSAAFRKLSHSLGGDMEIAWHELEQALSVRSSGTGLADMQVFDVLAKAVMEGAEVEFAYHKLAGEKPERRTVQPYHLGCIENQWYLFGHDADRGAVRTFALPRIGSVEKTGGKFRRPKDFSLAKVLEGSFAVFEGGRARQVRVRFSGVAARLVGERVWHTSQQLRRDKKGLMLEMKVGLSPDLRQWILGWGAEAEVLEPAELRRDLAAAAAAAARVYQPASNRRV